MLWKIRCIIAWTFRIIGIFAPFAALTALWQFGHREPREFNDVFPPPAGLALGYGIVLLGLCFELLGRLFSWTNVFERLPRFQNR